MFGACLSPDQVADLDKRGSTLEDQVTAAQSRASAAEAWESLTFTTSRNDAPLRAKQNCADQGARRFARCGREFGGNRHLTTPRHCRGRAPTGVDRSGCILRRKSGSTDGQASEARDQCFPDHELTIERLARSSETFRSMCQDSAVGVEALRRWEHARQTLEEAAYRIRLRERRPCPRWERRNLAEELWEGSG